MPEIPDFDRIADICLARVYEVRNKGLIAEHSVVTEQLRQIWNARGAADLQVIDQSLASQMGGKTAGPYVNNLERDVRKLDR